MNILSFGCGLQTACLAELCKNGEYKTPDHIIFSDTGWESKKTYEYLQYYIQKLNNIPFHIVSNGNIYKDIIENKTSFPPLPLYTWNDKGKKAILRRQCTMQYKIRPINAKIRQLSGLKRYEHGKHLVNLYIGISLDEVDRMKTNRVLWIKNIYPLVDLKMTRKDCENYLISHDINIPPKSACICCPYRSDGFLYQEKTKNTKEWQKLVKFEQKLNNMKVANKSPVYLHSQRVPVNQVIFKNRNESFTNECEGYCGI